MAQKNTSHEECSLSDSDLFTPAFVQTDIESGYYERLYAVSSLDDNGPIEFSIKNSSDKFLDLVNSYLQVKFKIVKGDGTNMAATDKCTVINFPIATLFSQIDITLGGKIISSSTNTYGYRALMETLLNYGQEAKETQLTMGLFAKDTSGHMDKTDPAAENENLGLKSRYSYCSSSKTISVCGRLHTTLFNQGRLLLNGVPLKITLHRQRDPFVLMSNGENPNQKIKLIDVVFSLRKAQLTAKKFGEIQQRLDKMHARYPVHRVEIKTHSVAAGLMSLNWDNAILGQLPNRVFVGLVDNEAFTGSYTKNPFNFKHYNLTSAGVYVNGKSLPQNPMKVDFASDDYLEAYRSMFAAAGKLYRDEGFHIDRTEYKTDTVYWGLTYLLLYALEDIKNFNNKVI